MKAFSNIFAARTFRKYVCIVAFCANAFLCHPVDAAVPIIRDCPVQCECSANENERLTAKCDGRLSWTGISYPEVGRFELRKQGGDGGQTTAPCNVPGSLWRIFPRLSAFDASRCHLSRISDDTFLHMDDLEEVDLSHNRLKTIDRSLFATNDKLKFVSLRGNPLRLDRNTPSLVASSSVLELDLSECNVIALSKHVFDGLPNLKFLSLSSNKIASVGPHVLPSDLRTLNLAANRITNVPIGELQRLENLVEIDLSSNAINCSCDLVGLQDSASRLLFVNSVKCAYPTQYAGKRLAFLSPYEVCDEWLTGTGASGKVDDENSINNRRVRSTLETDGMIVDVSDDVDRDQPNEFIDFRSDSRLKRSVQSSTFEGSGDAPEDFDSTSSETPSSGETTSSQPSTSVSTKDGDSSPSSEATSGQSSVTESTKASDTPSSGETVSSESPKDDPVNSSSSSEITSSQSSITESTRGSDTPSSGDTASSSSSENYPVDDSSSSETGVNNDTSPNTVASSSSETTSSQSSAGIGAPSTPAEAIVETKPSEVTGAGQTEATGTEQPSSMVSSSTIAAVNLPRSGSEESNPGYIIPIIVIVAIVTGSLSVYVCQHNCRRKTGGQEPSKKGKSATEMRMLMDGHNDHKLEPNDRSASYPNEEDDEQTEKLISNGDTAIEIVAAGTSVNADKNGDTTDDGGANDAKTSIRDINENARKRFFQIVVKQ